MLHKTRILSGMQIKQNLYRHDGLLATPKGYMINQREKQIIGYYDYEFILIEDKVIYKNEGSKLNEVLNIIEHVVTNSNMWTYSFGEELYDKFAEVVFKNKNRIKQLELMAELNAYHLTHYINTAIIVMSILTENNVKNLNTKTAEIFFLTLMHEIAKIETMRESSGQKYITKEE